jgi:hypothetical protein
VDLKGKPSPSVLAAVRAREPVPYAAIGSLADFFVVQMNWMYDLNYAAAFELVRERNVVRRLAEHLAPYPELRDWAAVTAAYVAAQPCGGDG